MADALSPAISDRICKHMNEDHADAVKIYAQVYGQVEQATAAQMASIDPQGMDLRAEVNGALVPVRIEFDHLLQDSEDAHQTLIAMIRQARAGAQSA
jgi:putative heme iron utilization protein